MQLMSLPDAWQWAQIGFCAALGASVVFILTSVLFAVFPGSSAVRMPEMPEPHCSRCCPSPDDEE